MDNHQSSSLLSGSGWSPFPNFLKHFFFSPQIKLVWKGKTSNLAKEMVYFLSKGLTVIGKGLERHCWEENFPHVWALWRKSLNFPTSNLNISPRTLPVAEKPTLTGLNLLFSFKMRHLIAFWTQGQSHLAKPLLQVVYPGWVPRVTPWNAVSSVKWVKIATHRLWGGKHCNM